MNAQRPDPWQWRQLLTRQIRLDTAVAETDLAHAAGGVLAADVHSPEAIPAVPVSAMDGFAVCRSDLAPGHTALPVATDLPARPGTVPALVPGSASRIMTGAPVPVGADAVIPVEHTDADPVGPAPATVTLFLDRIPDPGRHIRGVGEEVPQGALLAEAGDRVGAALIGLAQALGLRTLPLRTRPRVSIVVTGDELAQILEDDQDAGTIRESNGTMLAAAVAADAAHARVLLSGDDPHELDRVLERAADGTDLVITTGGIGHGAYDVVKELLGPTGRDSSRFEHLALRPGGPQGYGQLPDGTPVVHLPGTPVGAFVGYHLFIRPLLNPIEIGNAELLGAESAARPGSGWRGVHAHAGRLSEKEGQLRIAALPGRRLAAYGRADALILQETSRARDSAPHRRVRFLPLL